MVDSPVVASDSDSLWNCCSRADGIELHLTECAMREVAERAVTERTGARGLLTVLEDTLRDFKFELPGRGIERLEVDAATVREPHAALEALLARR